MDCIIREASPEDVNVLFEITKHAFLQYQELPVPPAGLLESVDDVLHVLVSGQEKAVILYEQDEPVASVRFLDEDGLYFKRLSVLPSHRGKGLSKKLIGWLEQYEQSRGGKRIYCQVRKTLPQNVELYVSVGFESFEEKTVRLNGNEAVFFMMQKLINLEEVSHGGLAHEPSGREIAHGRSFAATAGPQLSGSV